MARTDRLSGPGTRLSDERRATRRSKPIRLPSPQGSTRWIGRSQRTPRTIVRVSLVRVCQELANSGVSVDDSSELEASKMRRRARTASGYTTVFITLPQQPAVWVPAAGPAQAPVALCPEASPAVLLEADRALDLAQAARTCSYVSSRIWFPEPKSNAGAKSRLMR